MAGQRLSRNRGFSWRDADRQLARRFGNTNLPAPERYALLFRYFVSGFLHHKLPHEAGARYPGALSNHGAAVDGMEGFTRIAPLVAAWLAGGWPAQVETLWDETVDLLALVKTGLVNGTDPASEGFWGQADDKDQRLTWR